MRILLIGDETLANDSIKKILSSEDNVDIFHLTASQFNSCEYNSTTIKSTLSFLDLTSFAKDPEECIRQIINDDLSDYVIVLGEYDSTEQSQKLLAAGAERYLSYDMDVKLLLKIISELGG